MDERYRFVGHLLDDEEMSSVCREFDISRKTGYKIWNRYKDHGLIALSDRSKRPVRYANQLPPQVEALIVRCRKNEPHWGARKRRRQRRERTPLSPGLNPNDLMNKDYEKNKLIKLKAKTLQAIENKKIRPSPFN